MKHLITLFAFLMTVSVNAQTTLIDATTNIVDDVDNSKIVQLQVSGISTSTTRTLTVPDANTTIVGTDATQTLTNKTIDADNNTITNIDNSDIKVGAAVDASKIGDGSVSNTEFQRLGSIGSNVVGESDTQTLTNKTFTDNSTYTQDNLDNTKKVQLELSGITTSTTRTLAVPDANTTIVGTDATQTLTNKTINADQNTITNIDNSDIKAGAAVDASKIGDGSVSNTEFQRLGSITSNVVGESDTQTLTNKTFTDNSTYTQDNADNTKKVQLELSGITTSTTRTLAVPDANTTIVGTDATQTLTNKTINADNNTITNIDNSDIKAGAAVDASKMADGSVSNSEFGYINSLTSNVQTQLNGKIGDINSLPADATPDAADYVVTYDASAATHKKVLIQNIADTGESNTASNIGTAGVGPFKQKTGVDFEFRNINAGSNKITVTNDAGNNTIDIDVDATNININNLLNFPLTTKGDLLSRDVSNNVRLPVGPDGFVLVADSYQASGLKWSASGGGGENNTASNVTSGGGLGVFKQKTGLDLEFKSLIGGSNLTVTSGASDLTIDLDNNVVITGDIQIDNIKIDGNTLSSTDTNGNINILPNGVGQVLLKADPITALGAVTKQYVDAVSSGADSKESVRAKTDTALPIYTQSGSGVGATLTANTNSALPNVDGLTLILSDRVLVDTFGSQSDTDNGIYTVTQVGDGSNPWILTRSTDADDEVNSGMFVFITEGIVSANSGYILTTNNPIIVDTTPLNFTQFTGAGQITAGKGITKTGNTFDVGGTSTIIANANDLEVNSSNTANQVLLSSGSLGIAATYGQLPLGNSDTVSGTLTVVNGGTGSTTHTAGNFLVGNGTSPITTTKAVPNGDVIGDTDAQTLTNKTIDADNNTISNIDYNDLTNTPFSFNTTSLTGIESPTNTASGDNSTAMGESTIASGGASNAMGVFTTASGAGSTAMGATTTASGRYSTTMGNRTTASDYATLAIGRYNTADASPNPNTFSLTNRAFIIGNGTGSGAESDAMTVLFDGTTTIAGDLTINSDARLKSNIISLGSTLAKLVALDGKSYTFKTDESKQKIGLLAQDVQDVFPELVKEGQDEQGTLSVNYQGLIPVLINAIKEQQTSIKDQQTIISEQQVSIKEQKQEIELLKQQFKAMQKD